MVQTFSDDKKIYSVDMMFAYIHIYKPKYNKINVEQFLKTLDYIVLVQYLGMKLIIL
jgi:hypothetical protein